jgi:small subunit ribosomal protein S18
MPSHSHVAARSVRTIRYFSDKGKGGDSDDPFGVNYEDGEGKLGPKEDLPPRYVRDRATGKFTGEVEQDLTDEELNMFKMDDTDRHRIITERLVKQWNKAVDESGDSEHQPDAARRIREEDMALNTLGRSVDAQSTKGITQDGEDAYEDKAGFSKPLSPNEFKSFQRFMQKDYKIDVDEDDIPVQRTRDATPNFTNADNEDLDMQWLTVAAQRVMSDQSDDPFADLMPSDLNPARKVNNRKSKKISKKLLHHNNLAFLRRYVTPSGQIMNRVQSRLGAKEQRKVAKLIKRARHLGLIPFLGQWKYANHGDIYEKDIYEDKDWEKELTRRGLVIRGRESDTKATKEA